MFVIRYLGNAGEAPEPGVRLSLRILANMFLASPAVRSIMVRASGFLSGFEEEFGLKFSFIKRQLGYSLLTSIAELRFK